MKPKLKSQRFATAADTRPMPPLELRTQRLSGSRLQRLNHRPPHSRPVPHPCPWQIAVGCGQQGPADCCRHTRLVCISIRGTQKRRSGVWQFAMGTIDAFSFIATLSTCRRVGWAESPAGRGGRAGLPGTWGSEPRAAPPPLGAHLLGFLGCWACDARVPSRREQRSTQGYNARNP